MGKQIKSTALTLDSSSMGSAPVGPAGTVRLRPAADSSALEASYNGAAYVTLGSGGAGTVRLDQVLDPAMAAPQVKTFAMANHQLVFHFAGAESEECFVLESTEPVTPGASSAILLIRASGATTEKQPLRIETRGAFALSVSADGKVAIGAESGLVHKLNVYHTNTGGTNVGVLHGSVVLGSGNTAVTMTGSELNTSDEGNTTALLTLKNVNFNLDRSSSAVANSSLICTNLDVESNINADTGTLRNISLHMQVHSSTLTTWEALRITAPGTAIGGAVTTKRAIITESGAGDVGFGTLTPAAQLHVSGTVQIDQSSTEAVTLYKYTSAADPFTLDFKRARGTSGSPSDLINGDVAGRLLFEGRLGGVFTHLGYLQASYDTTLGGGVVLGAGTFSQSRVVVTETGSIGSVTLFGGASNYFQVQTSGFQFSHGTTGSTYYKSATGYFVDLAIGTVSQVLTVTDTGGGVLLPRWGAAPGGGGSPPGGSATELQYRAGASTFGAVTNSAVSGANVTMGGTLSLDAAGSLDQSIVLSAVTASDTKITFTEYRGAATPILLQFDRSRGTQGSPTNLSSDDIIGELRFRGRVSGAFAQLGYLRGAYSSTDGGAVQLGAGATSGSGTRFVATVNSGAGIFDVGGNFFTVSGSGFQFSHGATGAIYYRSAGGLFTALAIGSTSQYLKGGTIPSWGSLDASHVTAGTLPLARGGTGSSLADPGSADRILFWDDSAGAVDWLTAGTGLTITGTTMTASGGAPGGATFDVQYRTAAPAFGGITQSVGGLLMGTSGAPPFFSTTMSAGVRYTYSPSSTIPGLNVGSLASGSNPSSPANGDIYYNSTAQKFRAYQNSAWVDMCSPAGSGSELQYRNAGAFGAVLSSSVDGAGVVTFGGGSTIWTSNSSVILSLRLYESTAANAPQLSVLRSRGTLASKSAVLAGDSLYVLTVAGQYDSAGQRTGGQYAFDAQGNFSTSSAPTVFKLKTTHLNSITPLDRLVLGGTKTLVDNTLTDLFTITFAAADQVGLGGEIHMMFIAKQVSGTVHTQVYRRVVSFIIGHNGATNTSMANFREEAGGQASAASNTTGFGGLSHAINADAAVSIGTNIPANPNLIATNTITYRILADSDLTTISQMTCYYHIIYHGEAQVTLS